MKTLPVILIFLGFAACSTKNTTDGRPNRGGKLTFGERANKLRGGSGADWSQGMAPGDADPKSFAVHQEQAGTKSLDRSGLIQQG